MSTDHRMRASDQDQEKVAELLCDAYAAGRLSREELDERSASAYSARTWGELQDLIRDLPATAAGHLVADLVARRTETRGAFAPLICAALLVLATGLTGASSPDRCGKSRFSRWCRSCSSRREALAAGGGDEHQRS